MMMTALSISKAWEETREIIRRDGRLLAILSLALVGLPSLVLAVVMPNEKMGDVRSFGETAAFLLGAMIALIGQMSLARMAMQPSTSVGGAISHGLSRVLPQIGAAFLAGLAIFGLCIPLIAVAAMMGVSENAAAEGALPAVVLLAMFATLALILFVVVRLILMTPVAVAERVGPIEILARSWNLTRGQFWRLLGFLLMLMAALVLLSLTLALVVGSLVILAFGTIEPLSLAALFIGLVNAIMSAAFAVVFVVMSVRMYAQLSGNQSISGS